MNAATRRMRQETTTMVKGLSAEVRGAGFSWRVTINHIGNNGYTYEKFCGEWRLVMRMSIPATVRRQLAAKIKDSIAIALGKKPASRADFDARMERTPGNLVQVGGIFLTMSGHGRVLECRNTPTGVVFTGGAFGEHALHGYEPERICAHWLGYIQATARSIHEGG